MLNAFIERCSRGTYLGDKRSQVSALNELFATAGAFLGRAGILCLTFGAFYFGRGDREGVDPDIVAVYVVVGGVGVVVVVVNCYSGLEKMLSDL